MTEMSSTQFFFAERMEELLKALIADASILTFRLFLHPDENGGCRGEVDLLFPSDLQRLDDLLRAEFDVDDGLSQAVGDVEEKGELALADYVFSLAAPRADLREWLPFAGRRCRLQVGTVLQGACDVLNASLGLSEGGAASPKLVRKLARMNALLEEAEEGYRILLSQAGVRSREERRERAFPSVSDDADDRRISSEEEQTLGLSRNGGDESQPERPLSASDRPDLASLRLFFSAHASWLETWERLASQRGISLARPPLAQQEETLRGLARLLEAAEIDDFRSLEEQFLALDEATLGARLDSLRRTFGEKLDAWKIDPYGLVFLVFLDVHWDTLKEKDLDALGIKAAMDKIRSEE